jgi:hypothetical protein
LRPGQDDEEDQQVERNIPHRQGGDFGSGRLSLDLHGI